MTFDEQLEYYYTQLEKAKDMCLTAYIEYYSGLIYEMLSNN